MIMVCGMYTGLEFLFAISAALFSRMIQFLQIAELFSDASTVALLFGSLYCPMSVLGMRIFRKKFKQAFLLIWSKCTHFPSFSGCNGNFDKISGFFVESHSHACLIETELRQASIDFRSVK